MPKFSVSCSSPHQPQKTYEIVKEKFPEDKDLRKLDGSFNCTFDDAKMTGHAKGQQFKALLSILPEGEQSRVDITVEIPLLLAPFKKTIQSTLEKKFSQYLS